MKKLLIMLVFLLPAFAFSQTLNLRNTEVKQVFQKTFYLDSVNAAGTKDSIFFSTDIIAMDADSIAFVLELQADTTLPKYSTTLDSVWIPKQTLGLASVWKFQNTSSAGFNDSSTWVGTWIPTITKPATHLSKAVFGDAVKPSTNWKTAHAYGRVWGYIKNPYTNKMAKGTATLFIVKKWRTI